MQPSFLRGMRQDIHKKEYKKRNRINSFFKRAGDGNRTHVSSLEGWCSTIELHPHIAVLALCLCFARFNDIEYILLLSICQQVFLIFSIFFILYFFLFLYT